VAATYRSIGDSITAPRRETSLQGSNNRRFTIDPDLVAQTVSHATNFDGVSFSRSFRMDVLLIPKTGDLKIWKRDFVSFLSMEAAALIPQLAMSSSGVPIKHNAQRYAHAMLVQFFRLKKQPRMPYHVCMLADHTVAMLRGRCCVRD
jgi:hypothetical protein